MPLVEESFRFRTLCYKKIDAVNVEEDIFELGQRAYEVEIVLMTPIDPGKGPKVHIPPLNHIGLWADNLEIVVDWTRECGVRFNFLGVPEGAAGHNVLFIYSKGNKKNSSVE